MSKSALHIEVSFLEGLYKWANFQLDGVFNVTRDSDEGQPHEYDDRLIPQRTQIVQSAVRPGGILASTDVTLYAVNSNAYPVPPLHEFPFQGTNPAHASAHHVIEQIVNRQSPVKVRVFDPDSKTDRLQIVGYMSRPQRTLEYGIFQITSANRQKFSELVPKDRIVDIFPGVRLGGGAQAEDAVPRICFGNAYRVPLVQLDENGIYFGPIEVTGVPGDISISAVYANGRVVPNAQWELVPYASDSNRKTYLAVKFSSTYPYLDHTIQADIVDNGLDENHAKAVAWVIRELGLEIDQTSFNAAEGVYSGLGYEVGGFIQRQQQANSVLKQLLLRGAFLNVGTDGKIRIFVDELGRHPKATEHVELSETENTILTVRRLSEIDIYDYLESFTLRGFFDPGLQNQNAAHRMEAVFQTEISWQGKEVIQTNQFIYDADTLKKECFYQGKVLGVQTKELSISVPLTHQTTKIGDRVDVRIPALGIEDAEWLVDQITWLDGGIDLRLTPWRGDQYAYVDTLVRFNQIDLPETETDWSGTNPSEPENFDVVETSLIDQNLIIVLAADCPQTNPENITELVFEVYHNFAFTPLQVIRKSVQPGERNVHVAFSLEEGAQTLDLTCYAYNSRNKVTEERDYRESVRALINNRYIAGGSLFIPQRVQASFAVPTLTLSWRGSPRVLGYRVYASTTNSIPSTPILETSSTTVHTDGEIFLGTKARGYVNIWVSAFYTDTEESPKSDPVRIFIDSGNYPLEVTVLQSAFTMYTSSDLGETWTQKVIAGRSAWNATPSPTASHGLQPHPTQTNKLFQSFSAPSGSFYYSRIREHEVSSSLNASSVRDNLSESLGLNWTTNSSGGGNIKTAQPLVFINGLILPCGVNWDRGTNPRSGEIYALVSDRLIGYREQYSSHHSVEITFTLTGRDLRGDINCFMFLFEPRSKRIYLLYIDGTFAVTDSFTNIDVTKRRADLVLGSYARQWNWTKIFDPKVAGKTPPAKMVGATSFWRAGDFWFFGKNDRNISKFNASGETAMGSWIKDVQVGSSGSRLVGGVKEYDWI